MKISIKIICCTILLLWAMIPARAQFTDGTKGLLCMPSAEFEEDATFMITNNFLNKAYTPDFHGFAWDEKHTFGYAFSITLWKRLEIAYSLTLNDSDYLREGVHLFNQDRHFSARVALLKDGEWGQKWLPGIAIGCIDPLTSVGEESIGDYDDGNIGEYGNGFFNRYYIVAGKSLATSIGDLAVHAGYQYSKRKDGMPTGFQAAMTWNPIWLNRKDRFLCSFRTTVEYDARAINLGLNAGIWKEHFEFMVMLFDMKYPMGGLKFKTVLKH